jgi:copper(I)-binding protein
MRKILVATTLFAAMAFGAGAQTASSLTVDNAWARATPPSAQSGAIYVTVTDHGAPDRLVGASTPVAGTAEVHETIREGDVMKMRPVAGLAISAGTPISMSPGGYHIMLTKLKQPLTSGQTFPVSLRFEKAGTVEATVTVKALGGAMNMGGAGHDMQHMDMPGMTKP